MSRWVAPWALVAAAGLGCVSEPAVPPARPLPRDACEERLGQLAERLLRFYVAHRRLPASREELLSEDEGGQPSTLICPVSGKPYIFEPQGLRSPGLDGNVLIYDSEGAHAGFRWGVLVQAPAGTQPLTAKVIALVDK